MSLIWLIFLLISFTWFTPITSGNDNSTVNDEKSILEYISQQMIAIDGIEFYANILKPDTAYQDFLNYVICENELTSAYYVKLVTIFEVLENKLKPIR